MDNIVETLFTAVALVALCLLVFILLFNVYLIKRNGFYVRVNCWFCNGWTKVPYSNRNSFECPSCSQYNGFDEDGGYNKIIEAQHVTSFNKYKTTKKTEPLANGLCTYCNNNQQLKVYQLANFVPMNEDNYEVEVEHFQKQLEKAYTLCKNCDTVLKTTIEKQHAWIFGNRLKSLREKGQSLFNLHSSQEINDGAKQSVFLRFIRYGLVFLSLLVLWNTLNIKVNYIFNNTKKYVPDMFLSYITILEDFYNIVSNILRSTNKDIEGLNHYFLKNKIKINTMTPVILVGCLLEIILVLWDRRSAWWKINELLSWTLLLFTSLAPFKHKHFVYVSILQVCSVTFLIFSLLFTARSGKKKTTTKKKFEFKKFRKNEIFDSSDEEDISEKSNSVNSKKSTSDKSLNGNIVNASFRQTERVSPKQDFLFQNNIYRNTAILNNSFTTAKSTSTASIFNNSYQNCSDDKSNTDLHLGLDNLHLSNINFKPLSCASPVFSVNPVNRPILSPPKLKNVTQNSWTAGGFWKNDATVFPVAPSFSHLSRSSSQSSGFVSSNDANNVNLFSSLPPSREPSVCGDIERASILSEPAYHFKPISSRGLNIGQLKNGYNYPRLPKLPASNIAKCQLYYKAENNVFYPVLNQNNMLLVQGSNIPVRNFESSFNNLSLKNFNIQQNRLATSVLFSKQPAVSNLFKNLSGISSQPHNFRKSQS